MANHALPVLASTYTNFLAEIMARANDSVMQNRTSVTYIPTQPTNLPTGSIRWNDTSLYWETNTGTAGTPNWVVLSSSYNINAATATALQTGRTISISSDATGTSGTFNGSANISFAVTLATVNSNVGAFGSTTAVPIITVNAKGLITAVSTAALGSIATQASSSVAITGGAISATALTLVQSAGAAPTASGLVQWDTTSTSLKIGNGAATLVFSADNAITTYTNKTLSTACTWNGTAVAVLYGGTGGTTQVTARTGLGLLDMSIQASSAVAITGGTMSGVTLVLKQSTTAAPTAEGDIQWDTDNDILVIGDSVGTKIISPDSIAATLLNKTLSTGAIISCATSAGTIAQVTQGGLRIDNNASGAAMISFNRTGTSPYSINFGLDTDNVLKFGGWGAGAIAYTIIHSGNIATQTVQTSGTCSGTAANATTLGTLALGATGNNVANQVVRTDASGYIQSVYLSCTTGNENNASSPPRIWGTNGTDGYLRSYQTAFLNVLYAASAGGIKNATTIVSNTAGAAPSTGQILVATSTTTATWQTVLVDPVPVNVTSTPYTAAANQHLMINNAASTTVNLPSGNLGDVIWVTVLNGLYTNVIAPATGQYIHLGAINETLTLDDVSRDIELRYMATNTAGTSFAWRVK